MENRKGKGKEMQGFTRRPRGRGRARGVTIRDLDSEYPAYHSPVPEEDIGTHWTPPTFTERDFFSQEEATLPPESQEDGDVAPLDEPQSSRASAIQNDDEWVVDEDGRRLIEPLGDS